MDDDIPTLRFKIPERHKPNVKDDARIRLLRLVDGVRIGSGPISKVIGFSFKNPVDGKVGEFEPEVSVTFEPHEQPYIDHKLKE